MTIAAPSTRTSPVQVAAGTLAVRGGTPVSATKVPFMATALTAADKEAVVQVLDSGMLRAAKKCEELENRFGAMSQAKHAMTCANGTCALQLAYEPLFARGDDVLVPAWSYIATVSMVVARGGNPVFVDADPATGQIDAGDAARKVTKNTRAIAATHMYGCPVDVDEVLKVAKAHNLKVIFDAAQAHLATWRGEGLGKFGDAVTYSFYATKNLGTGEGGMITCNDDALARQIKLLRSHGETEKYLHEQVGYNYRMNDMAGAVGCSRLDRLEAETKARRALAARYDAFFAQGAVPGVAPLGITPGAVSAYHLYTVRIEEGRFNATRDEFGKALDAEGVPNAVHYPKCLTRQPAFAKFATENPKVSGQLAKEVMSLPMHHAISDEHFRIVTEAVAKVAAALRR
jgi:perosamine synthetase